VLLRVLTHLKAIFKKEKKTENFQKALKPLKRGRNPLITVIEGKLQT